MLLIYSHFRDTIRTKNCQTMEVRDGGKLQETIPLTD